MLAFSRLAASAWCVRRVDVASHVQGGHRARCAFAAVRVVYALGAVGIVIVLLTMRARDVVRVVRPSELLLRVGEVVNRRDGRLLLVQSRVLLAQSCGKVCDVCILSASASLVLRVLVASLRVECALGIALVLRGPLGVAHCVVTAV